MPKLPMNSKDILCLISTKIDPTKLLFSTNFKKSCVFFERNSNYHV